ncbi:MAG: hypothetical protein HOI95_01310, partial [Chromatiales bacterium]|nr:hypothetical protein [Chromatiales bacterium]
MEHEECVRRLRELFGPDATYEHSLATSGMGVRLSGIDLCGPLRGEQVSFLFDLLSSFRLLCIAGQDLQRFSLDHFECFANYWGAPIPHPSNFLRGGKPAQRDGSSDGPIEFLAYEDRRVAVANRTLPSELQCL